MSNQKAAALRKSPSQQGWWLRKVASMELLQAAPAVRRSDLSFPQSGVTASLAFWSDLCNFRASCGCKFHLWPESHEPACFLQEGMFIFKRNCSRSTTCYSGSLIALLPEPFLSRSWIFISFSFLFIYLSFTCTRSLPGPHKYMECKPKQDAGLCWTGCST